MSKYNSKKTVVDGQTFDCFSCTHLVDWMDEFGDRWLECELLNVPFNKINPGECPLKKEV